jgi:hypothetical protein
MAREVAQTLRTGTGKPFICSLFETGTPHALTGWDIIPEGEHHEPENQNPHVPLGRAATVERLCHLYTNLVRRIRSAT